MGFILVPSKLYTFPIERLVMDDNPTIVNLNREYAQLEYESAFGAVKLPKEPLTFFQSRSTAGILYELITRGTIQSPKEVIYLSTFIVPREERLKGQGTHAFETFCQFARQYEFTYVLSHFYKPEVRAFFGKKGFQDLGMDTWGFSLVNQ
jgi:hypothetical protein